MGSQVGHVDQLALVQVTTLPGDDYETVLRSLKITPSFGAIWYTDLDLGSPAADVDESRFPNDNGVYDGTKYFGARAVALTVTVADEWFPGQGTDSWDPRWNYSAFWVKELGRWSAPGFRSWMYVKFQGDPAAYRIDLSGRGKSDPIATTDRNIRKIQLNFSSPSGILREFSPDLELSRVTKDGRLRLVIPYGGSEVGGVTLPITFPIVFPVGGSGLGATLTYDGTVATGFICRVHAGDGPIENPKITVTGPLGNVVQVGFQGLTIDAGHFLEINSETKRLLIDGDPTQPAEKWLLGALRFPKLESGPNLIAFTVNLNADDTDAATPGAGSYAEALYYPASV